MIKKERKLQKGIPKHKVLLMKKMREMNKKSFLDKLKIRRIKLRILIE